MAMGGLGMAFALVLLYLSAISPRGSLSLVAIAGFVPYFVHCFSGISAGLLCWAGVSLLSLLLIPDKSVCFLFALVLGPYPLVKTKVEGLKLRGLQVAVKLLYASAVCVGTYGIVSRLLLSKTELELNLPLVLLGWNVIFFVYDAGLSRVLPLIRQRLRLEI